MSKDLIELSDKEPYVTPSVLERNTQKAVTPPPDDTEAEDSEVEQMKREKVKKAERKANHLHIYTFTSIHSHVYSFFYFLFLHLFNFFVQHYPILSFSPHQIINDQV